MGGILVAVLVVGYVRLLLKSCTWAVSCRQRKARCSEVVRIDSAVVELRGDRQLNPCTRSMPRSTRRRLIY